MARSNGEVAGILLLTPVLGPAYGEVKRSVGLGLEAKFALAARRQQGEAPRSA